MASWHRWVCALFLVVLPGALWAASARREISIRWESGGAAGNVVVDRGTLESARAPRGTANGNSFRLPAEAPGRLDLVVRPESRTDGLPTLVTLNAPPRGFTFRLEDIDAAFPVWMPADRVVITDAADARSYAEIVARLQQSGAKPKLTRIAEAPEASFAAAAVAERKLRLETWLGVGRDVRVFRIDENLESLQPRFAGYEVPLAETGNQAATYAFQFGRGWSVRESVRRWLDDQALPILRGEIDDENVRYDITMFAALERSPLTGENIRGTEFLVADAFGHGHMLTPAQKEKERQQHESELNPPEEIVLHVRAIATNRGTFPQYAWLKMPTPRPATPTSPPLPPWSFDPVNGLGVFESGRVFAAGRLDGRPLPADEISVLLRPGASATLDFFLSHRPLTRERALALATQSFDRRLAEARTFWQTKLAAAARWRLPEPRIEAMTRAGLLHLDLVAYGREPRGPLVPAIGVYTAIGSESAPIIQFMDTMGWHDRAERALDFFLEKQHDDGFMQNFNGYMLETGAVLWTLGEHYRYTRDDAWLRRIHSHVTKACVYLEAWRQRNLKPELQGHGFGLLDGKTADPEDPYRSFMLNGYAYLGLARAAEMLRELAPDEAARWLALAAALKKDIRTALAEAMVRSPVVPLSDGRWIRSAPPWTDYRGPVMLHADGGRWFTHGSMAARDSLLGPLYLVFQEVFSPDEPVATELLELQSEFMTRDNVAFSQPYYSRHPWVHLQRGETKAFLQAWYGTVAALADRETYTFSEHLFPVSAHKTHEEAWFLMETRWMLYLEANDTLRLFAGIPRDWLRPGAEIAVKNASSYFGPLTFEAKASADGREIRVTVDCPGGRPPQAVEIRVPHPSGRRASAVEGGRYAADREVVRVESFRGHAEVRLRYDAP